jgi:hypothetical protein
MSDMTEARVREILDGLEGVTPGPWTMVDVSPGSNAMVCDMTDTILSVHRRTRPKKFEVAIADHVARLDPDTVRGLCTLALSAIASRQPVVKPTMWADVIEDPFSGQIVWLCSEEGNKGEDTTEPLLQLFANTFPVGTRIEIVEPSTLTKPEDSQ